jgi:hypothetical protein
MTLARLSDRELATVLAALRLWQRTFAANASGCLPQDHFNDRITPLTEHEIDDLCERLNLPS